MKKLGIAFVLVSGLLVAACSSSSDTGNTSGSSGTTSGSSGSSGATPEAGAPAGNNITVMSNKFVPNTLEIKVGDTVTWTWAGGAHSVTSGKDCVDDKEYGEPVTSMNGHTFSHKYDKAGTFEYFCIPHCSSSNMKGTITVK